MSRDDLRDFLFNDFLLEFLDRLFLDFGHPHAPKLVPKSTPNGAQVHSQRPPGKDPTNFTEFNNFRMTFQNADMPKLL